MARKSEWHRCDWRPEHGADDRPNIALALTTSDPAQQRKRTKGA